MKEDFLKELSVLLLKYNASIGFTCDSCSDTYGITGDAITIEQGDKEVIKVWGWCIDGNDLT